MRASELPSWLEPLSVEVGPFFSSDGTILTSRLDLEAKRGEEPFGGEVLWCFSPYDPRCSPSSPVPEDSPQWLGRAHAAGTSDASPRLRDRAPTSSIRADIDGGPRAGVQPRVERPPRG